jgi:Bifunctional DNA primase/polymerase, N-terminal
MNPLAKAAIELVEAIGCPVALGLPGTKRPATRYLHGSKYERATTNHAEIERRFNNAPDSNLFVVMVGDKAGVDVDPRHGGERPAWLPDSLEARTPQGGMHVIVRTDGEVRNSVSRVAPGVDIRGAASHGILWASPSQTAKGRYEWLTPLDMPLAYVPAMTLSDHTDGPRGAGGSLARAGERKRPENVHQGERHDQALRWCGWFAQNYNPDEAEELTWRLVERFADPVERGDENIQRVIDYVTGKQLKADEIDREALAATRRHAA